MSERPEGITQRSRIGHYQLITPLGTSTSESAWKAVDTRSKELVALQIFPQVQQDDPAFGARVVRQAQWMIGLNHPNLVKILGAGEIAGSIYIATRFIDGQSLAELIKSGQRFTIEQAVGWIQQVADALDYAHKNGVIHRDVNPSNILIDLNGKAYLTDLGLLSHTEKPSMLTPGVDIKRNPTYSSPELLMGYPVGPAADIYSLAVIAYELLCGKPPFQAENALTLLRAHVHEVPPPPSRFNPAISSKMDRIFLRALSKDPSTRYPTAVIFATALILANSPGMKVSYNPMLGISMVVLITIISAIIIAAITGEARFPPMGSNTPTPTRIAAVTQTAIATSISSMRFTPVPMSTTTPPPAATVTPPTAVRVTPVPMATITPPPGATVTPVPAPTATPQSPTVTPVPIIPNIAMVNLVAQQQPDGSQRYVADLTLDPIGLGKMDLSFPLTITLGESGIVRLEIYQGNSLAALPHVTGRTLPPATQMPGELFRFSDEVDIYPVMFAHLTSDEALITSTSDVERPVVSDAVTVWTWSVRSSTDGIKQLILTLGIPVLIDQQQRSSQILKSVLIKIHVVAPPTAIPTSTSTPTITPTPTPIPFIAPGSGTTIAVAVLSLIGVLSAAGIAAYANIKASKNKASSAPTETKPTGDKQTGITPPPEAPKAAATTSSALTGESAVNAAQPEGQKPSTPAPRTRKKKGK